MTGGNKMKYKLNKAIWLVIMIANFMLLSGLVVPNGPAIAGSSTYDISDFDLESYAQADPSMNPTIPSNLPVDYGLPEASDYLDYISDTPNDYHKIWEPWLTKAGVHAVAVSDDNEFLAVVGGYLADDEIHIYRWNAEEKTYDKVWDAGDGIIQGDIRAAAFGDTDYNDFLEIIIASSDGHIYVFEQRHIFDPITNTENQFELVWKSPAMAPVWGLTIKDLDKDYRPDIIAGSWDGKVHIFEWLHHGNYPFSGEHWIEYEEVWTSEYLGSQITSLVSGDVNYNGLPDFVVGTRNGTTHIFENDGEVLMVNGAPFPLCNDNHYEHI
ncbi:MAG: FG-GAP-like repeat-containing protein, partial [Candidatus Kariarchaeaceae archaeon]